MIRNLLLLALAVPLVPVAASAQTTPVGAAFSMTNASAGNEVVAFERDAQGLLTQAATFATNGTGNDQPLGSQGSIILSKDGEHLLVVNAGSDEITLFGVSGTTLTVQDTVSSGGSKPVSLALRDDTLYVLNAGNPNNITGFEITAQNTLTPVPNSTRPLSANQTNPGHVAWSPSGKALVVTEKDTANIDWFKIDPATDVSLQFELEPSADRTPFAVAFRGANHFYAAQADEGTADGGSVTAYGLRPTVLWPLTTVPTTESATCWIVVTQDKKFAYTSNTMSNSITGFRVGAQGALQMLDPNGVTATAGVEPIDVATTRNSKYLYALNRADGTLSGWSIDNASGALTSLQTPVGGLPVTGAASGLAVR